MKRSHDDEPGFEPGLLFFKGMIYCGAGLLLLAALGAPSVMDFVTALAVAAMALLGLLLGLLVAS